MKINIIYKYMYICDCSAYYLDNSDAQGGHLCKYRCMWPAHVHHNIRTRAQS